MGATMSRKFRCQPGRYTALLNEQYLDRCALENTQKMARWRWVRKAFEHDMDHGSWAKPGLLAAVPAADRVFCAEGMIEDIFNSIAPAADHAIREQLLERLIAQRDHLCHPDPALDEPDPEDLPAELPANIKAFRLAMQEAEE
jgi:hypothetical protein